MKEFLLKGFSKFNKSSPSLMLLASYLVKALIIEASYVDAIIVLSLCFSYLGSMYFSVKSSVISENEFRLKVNQDIGDIKNKLNSLSMQQKGNLFTKPVK